MLQEVGNALFAQTVNRPDSEIALDVAALLIGDWEREALDVAYYTGLLDRWAERAHDRATVLSRADDAQVGVPNGIKDGAKDLAGISALNYTLFSELGFRGNAEHYYDPRNSFIADVVDRRMGIPITLSVVYLEVARRMGLAMSGVGFPGHFLVRFDRDSGDTLIIDPFRSGAFLDRDSLGTLLTHIAGDELELSPELLQPASKKQILTRMLTNLASIYADSGDSSRLLIVLERMRILDPENAHLARQIADVHAYRSSQLN